MPSLTANTITGDLIIGGNDLTGQSGDLHVRGSINGTLGADVNASAAKATALGATVARTMEARFGDVVNVLDEIPASAHAAIGAGTGSFDCTSYIQSAINRAGAVANGKLANGVVLLPPGTYHVTRLTLPFGVTLRGAGVRATYLKALTHVPAEEHHGMIEMPKGPVIYAGLRDLSLCGATAIGGSTVVNAGQWALYLHARLPDTGTQHGGLWWSTFENVAISGFAKGIWSRGGSGSSADVLPMQFNNWRNITCTVASGAGNALRLSGEHGQQTFDGFCQFDGSGKGNGGTNILIGPDPDAGAFTADNLLFTQLTSQDADIAMNLTGEATIVEGQFEGLKKAHVLGSGAILTSVGVKYANINDGGAGGVVEEGTNSTHLLMMPKLAGAIDAIVRRSTASKKGRVISPIAIGGAATTIVGTGSSARQAAVGVDGNVNGQGGFVIQTNASATPITNISGNYGDGDMVTLLAFGGSLTIGGGNIKMPTATPTVTIPENGCISFVRTTFGGATSWWPVFPANAI